MLFGFTLACNVPLQSIDLGFDGVFSPTDGVVNLSNLLAHITSYVQQTHWKFEDRALLAAFSFLPRKGTPQLVVHSVAELGHMMSSMSHKTTLERAWEPW